MDEAVNLKVYTDSLSNLQPLLSSNAFQGYSSYHISQVDVPENQVLKFNERLFGKRMEEVFHQILLIEDTYQIIAENLQIKDGKQTIGELDFLIKDKNQFSLTHVELAVKFYVYPPNLTYYDFQEWIGPNQHDRFADKLHKLFNKQLPLMKNTLVKEALSINQKAFNNIESKFCLVGMLFIPEGFQLQDDFLNPASIGGNCYFLQELQEVMKDYSEAYIPQKIEWPLVLENHIYWQSSEAIFQEIKNPANKTGSFMLWLKNEYRYQRCFILDW